MKSLIKVILWFPATIVCLCFSIFTYSKITTTRGMNGLIRQEITE